MATLTQTAGKATKPFDWKPVKIWGLYFVGLLPAAWYFYLGAMGDLGGDPVRTFEHALGLWAVRFLLATLTVTPIFMLGGPNLVGYRRALGLLAFWYVLFHFTVYMVLDQGLNISAVIADIVKRWYITIGMAGFVMLIPLALTSNRFSIRKLGPRWQKLHKLSYLVIIAGVLHFVMSTKVLLVEQMIYIVLTAILLSFRIFKKPIMNWRKERMKAKRLAKA
jgi:methionine sulfoxide reductase heme-binding subunit